MRSLVNLVLGNSPALIELTSNPSARKNPFIGTTASLVNQLIRLRAQKWNTVYTRGRRINHSAAALVTVGGVFPARVIDGAKIDIELADNCRQTGLICVNWPLNFATNLQNVKNQSIQTTCTCFEV